MRTRAKAVKAQFGSGARSLESAVKDAKDGRMPTGADVCIVERAERAAQDCSGGPSFLYGCND
ncbi:hypothetical protein PI124_g15435 [Phytophthora idaei]|nr:hypothetical protein PI125_g15145 [Phytophthora idaei]KAG3144089.1 hypothetical protein PI126_g14317 [Phytophthora idaei]KAG3239630.1 hypothetical protein PI124_g15435 [Phytophthora idaei]